MGRVFLLVVPYCMIFFTVTVSSFTVEQNNVAAHRQGHALVSAAVLGSGKTEVLVERTVQMLNEGIPADRMLILMFNKSAQEDSNNDYSHVWEMISFSSTVHTLIYEFGNLLQPSQLHT